MAIGQHMIAFLTTTFKAIFLIHITSFKRQTFVICQAIAKHKKIGQGKREILF